MSDLKPCPFCGKAAETRGPSRGLYHTGCYAPTCCGWLCRGESKTQAEARWNTRAEAR